MLLSGVTAASSRGWLAAKQAQADAQWKALYAWYMQQEAWAGRVSEYIRAAFYVHGLGTGQVQPVRRLCQV